MRKLLIANRGEIACRVIRSAKALGIETVAVYSDADRNAAHVNLADEAIHIGAADARDSYLNAEKIIAAALNIKADAIHPGYGFLSENAAFASAVIKAGITFVGPNAETIEAMGSKSAAKQRVTTAGVPVLPGYHGTEQDFAAFQHAAEQCGYPILLKASAGGGGKGMRSVFKAEELEDAYYAAKREAAKSFADDRLLLEKLITKPRHVEVQIFADNHGHCIYLSERDCSIQRRHQKVVEEAPAPDLNDKLRKALGEAAVTIAKSINYLGAGTVEFLLDESGQFYFMEVNTRLQVEHPVTEMICGVDLVAWQLRIAMGEALPISQDDINVRGHAIEVRICAEDPDNGYLPATGNIDALIWPQVDDKVRVDAGIQVGDHIGVFYDPLLAKLIAWGEDRAQAQQRLSNALEHTFIAGVITNLDLLRVVVNHPAFIDADVDTGFLARHFADTPSNAPDATELRNALIIAAIARYFHYRKHCESDAQRSRDPYSPWWQIDGWRHGHASPLRYAFNSDQEQFTLGLVPKGNNQFGVTFENRSTNRHEELDVGANEDGDFLCLLTSDQKSQWYVSLGDTLVTLQHKSTTYRLGFSSTENKSQHTGAELASDVNTIRAPMTGTVIAINVGTGQQIKSGDIMIIVEAMKMEHALRAPNDGIITEIQCALGDLVQGAQVLLQLDTIN